MTKEEAHKCLHEVELALLIQANRESIIAQNKSTKAQKEVLAVLNGKDGLISDSVSQGKSLKRAWKFLWVLFTTIIVFALAVMKTGVIP